MPGVLSVSEERLDDVELQRQAEYFADGFITRHLLDAVPTLLLILNRQRQIVYANRTLFELTGGSDMAALRGLRPGEALRCLHAQVTPDGCGSGQHCQACGMLATILASLDGNSARQECRVTRHREGKCEALDLRVSTTPIEYGGETFTIFSIVDISHEKRRQALERIFFHDILNLAGGIRGFAEVLLEPEEENPARVVDHIRGAAERIIDEILAQRTLAAAESQDLEPQPSPVAADSLLGQVLNIYRFHEVSQGRDLMHAKNGAVGLLVSDPTLLGRVLGNMVKNALEATPRGGVVSAGCADVDGEIEFWVHNPGVIPDPVRLQIFQRSFSTRDAGRGLGTYSMRLLSEDYLGGRVGFSSSVKEGTRFFARFPRQWRGR
ncbi:ATP-binding protein [Desulfuromonas carbonis]|uniref:PAS domain-containing sensor histidine kinase n=1 Tax=Desulfuromonas sp. DDH964 TaxID=1823759 RepID=UPI00078D40CC|nr:PAS domain-containing sensor histidine kinase [Desulfuromonas sp. DDH964]AMV71640.1 sensor histidine kinase [Desulfuromonas sp. DDH964]